MQSVTLMVAYEPRADRLLDNLVMVADHLDLLRQARIVVLTLGLTADVGDDLACLDRLAPVDASSTSTVEGLRRHTLSNIIVHRVPRRGLV